VALQFNNTCITSYMIRSNKCAVQHYTVTMYSAYIQINHFNIDHLLTD